MWAGAGERRPPGDKEVKAYSGARDEKGFPFQTGPAASGPAEAGSGADGHSQE